MISHDELKRIMDYSPETGLFRSRRNVNTNKVGAIHPNGYVNIKLFGKAYLAHRLAWFYVTGAWPEQTIDHINGQKSDNRFCNLREATFAQNSANMGPHKDNQSGIKGVTRYRRKWRAFFLRKQLGVFETKEEAGAAYLRAAQARYGEFARNL
jgi:hypothetical protein